MITATIQNIITSGALILVYVIFSNSTNPVIYTFSLTDTMQTITAKIQKDLNDMNTSTVQCTSLAPLINTTVSPSVTGTVAGLKVDSLSSPLGSTISIPVVGNFAIGVNSIQFSLSFDPALLSVSSVTVGSANKTWTIVDNTAVSGKVTVGMFNVSGPAVLGATQQIAVVNFTVNPSPSDLATSSPLTLSATVFDQNTINNFTQGTFTVGTVTAPI